MRRPRQSDIRITALLILCLLFGVGISGVATHRAREPVSFDSVIEIWASIFRDIDRFGLTITSTSSDREMAIGTEIDHEIRAHYGVEDDSARARYLRDVGSALVPFVERHRISYSFAVLDSPKINAFAVAGGRIYVTTGMLSFVKSEAELAAILGHEISHVDLKHCVERLQYELAARKVAGDDIAAIVGVGYWLIELGFSEQEELEADVNGVILMAKAGYNPRMAIGIYERLGELETPGKAAEAKTMVGEITGALVQSLQSYFATHPPASVRMPAIENALERNAAAWQGQKFYVGKQNYETWRSRSEMDLPGEWVQF
jgi:predicted Zn-dependent protease